MGQFAHVAGPAVFEQGPHAVGGEAGHAAPVALRELLQEVHRQQRNVFPSRAQRRQHDLDGVEPKEQVFAEPAGGDLGPNVGVGGGNDAYVHFPRTRRPDPLELPGLQHAQELGLLRQRQVGDFVEKERAAVGEFEPPDPIGLGISEGALGVTEQLALEHAIRKSAEVDRHHRARCPCGRRVEPRGDDLLAGAVFAGDQRVRVRGPDPFHQPKHRLHRWGFGNQLRGASRTERCVFAFEALAPAQCATEFDLRVQHMEQAGVVEWFLDIVAGTTPEGGDGSLDAAPGGHDDDRQGRVELLEPLQQIETFAAAGGIAGVVHVDEGGGEVVASHRCEDSGRRHGGLEGVALAAQ